MPEIDKEKKQERLLKLTRLVAELEEMSANDPHIKKIMREAGLKYSADPFVRIDAVIKELEFLDKDSN